ncbi:MULTISPECIES: hypothetical protein [unclassified Micromonospora]|nr:MULTISPECIES: hypothetical protein [unclassified Micromonospora]
MATTLPPGGGTPADPRRDTRAFPTTLSWRARTEPGWGWPVARR